MNGYGQPMITPEQYAQALTSFDSMQRQQNTRDLINARGNGYSQIGAALGQALAGKFGKNKGQNMGELEQQILQFQEAKKMEAEQREAQKLAQQQQAKQADQMKALVPQFGEQGAAAIVFGGAKPSDVKQESTSLMQNLQAAGISPGTPEYRQAIMQGIAKPSTNVNVNSGDQSTQFQKKLGDKNAEKFIEWENEAWVANETMAKLQEMNKISELVNTGKMQEAIAIGGQWFGSDASTHMQTFRAT